MTDHEHFSSPFSWRYGSEAMRRLWGELHRRRLMRQVWLALAEAQLEAGLVTDAQVEDLRRSVDDVDMALASEIERETRHDVMAEIRAWAQQAPIGGGALHLGATSADITDNVDAIRVRDALQLLCGSLGRAILALADRVDEHADLVTLGWTHLQPAAPTTVGYRLAGALQDLTMDLEQLDGVATRVRGKGFKGAVGTAASYRELLGGVPGAAAALEAAAMARLGLTAAEVTTQVYPRKIDWLVLNALAGVAASASTLAYNVRLMQSPAFGEWSEGFAEGQVGSTAMPWKRNPITAENVNSLARFVSVLPIIAWQNEAANLLERTLDDSANRRLILPEAFLATDEIVVRTGTLVRGLQIEHGAVAATAERYAPFAALEVVMLEAAAAGGSRQEMHEWMRQHAMQAWRVVERGGANRLADTVAADDRITQWLAPDRVRALFARPLSQVGDAPERARAMALRARQAVDRLVGPCASAPDTR